MDIEKLLKTKKFLDEMAASVRNIIFDTFPNTSPQEREDIEQDVKLKIWRQVENVKKFTNFRSYLWKVVYTTALNVIDRRMETLEDEKIQEISDSFEFERLRSSDPEIQCQNKEMMIILRKAVNTLPDRRKAVLQLWLLDMNLEEIASSLGWGANQVRHLLYRGIEELKNFADEESE